MLQESNLRTLADSLLVVKLPISPRRGQPADDFGLMVNFPPKRGGCMMISGAKQCLGSSGDQTSINQKEKTT